MKENILSEILPDIMPTVSGIVSPYRIYRYDKGEERYYFTFPENGNDPTAYLSVTEFVKKSLPTSPYLIKWIADLGKEQSRYFAQVRADYGTLLHITITDILKTGKGDFSEIADNAYNAAIEHGYKFDALNWANDIVKDVAAFLQFAKDKELEVIAAEFPIVSKYLLGCCIDLIARVKFGTKKVNCIIDIKSGRKGFWDSHEMQLTVYKKIWNDHYKYVFPVDYIFNWAPTDWRKKPAYKLQNQTGNKFEDSIDARLSVAISEGWIDPPKAHMEITGAFTVNNFDFEEHLNYTSYADSKKKQPELF